MLPRPESPDTALERLQRENVELRARLREAEETLEAIRQGDVDAVVVGGAEGHKVYTLENADRPYRMLIEQMQEGAVTLNADGLVLYCNHRFTAMLGYSQERVVGGAFHRFVPGEDRATVDWLISSSAEAGGRGEFTLVREDGATLPVHLSFAVLASDGERILCGIVTDLTGQRERNRELAETNARLQAEIAERESAEARLRQVQKMEAVGQLTGGLAHDFNNLLMIIAGNLQLLEARLTDERLAPLIGHALSAADRGARLTGQLLAFSRRQDLQSRSVCINSLLPALAPLVRQAIGAGIAMEIIEGEALWHCCTDPNQLENALLNLAINARDAMPGGGSLRFETANVTVDADAAAILPDARPGRYVAVSVTDTGEGMSPDIMERALEPFFTTKEIGKGSGLGLSMIYGFVRQSGGHLTLESAPGKGTRVSLHLPWSEPPPAEEHAEDRVPSRQAASGTVLVVEDDADVRQLVVSLVAALGYSVLDAADGATALEMLDRHAAVDLVFSDVAMPGGMSGIDLAHQIRRRCPDTAILLTSGFTARAQVHDPALATTFPILNKPYRHEDLAEALQLALEQRPGLAPSPPSAVLIGETGERQPRVLLVEDELLVAMAVQEMFDELGYEVVGPVARLDEAIAAARSESLDAALLDISLAGTLSYPVADVLVARGVPFVFASGYGLPPDRNDYSGIPTLVKPYRISQLEQVLAGLIRKTASD